jgi:large subunit ribosomal protein L6
MSRIGKMPVPIPPGVTVSWNPPTISVKGPKGELNKTFPSGVTVEITDGKVVVRRLDDGRENRMRHGLVQSLIKGMVHGVNQGYEERLEVLGVGYKAELKGQSLLVYLGFTHPKEYPIPAGLKITVDRAMVTITGADKQQVGQAAAQIRAMKPPEPYKGKGIKYAAEVIRRKAGKATVAGGGKQ